MKVPASLIVEHLKRKFGTCVVPDDIHNVRKRLIRDAMQGLNEDQQTSSLFKRISEADPGCVIQVITDDN